MAMSKSAIKKSLQHLMDYTEEVKELLFDDMEVDSEETIKELDYVQRYVSRLIVAM